MFSMTGYFFVGSKFVGRMMTPQMSVVPSRPFATNTSGGFQPGLRQLGDVAALELASRATPSVARRSSDTGGRSTRD